MHNAVAMLTLSRGHCGFRRSEHRVEVDRQRFDASRLRFHRCKFHVVCFTSLNVRPVTSKWAAILLEMVSTHYRCNVRIRYAPRGTLSRSCCSSSSCLRALIILPPAGQRRSHQQGQPIATLNRDS